MKEAEIRNWLKEKKLADEWWVMLDDEELNDEPMSLDEVFKLHGTVPDKSLTIVQISEQESGDPNFITLEKLAAPRRKAFAKKLPAKKIPVGGPLEGEPSKDSDHKPSPMAGPPAGMPDTPPPFAQPSTPISSPPLPPDTARELTPISPATPIPLPSVTIPEVTKPTGAGGLSAQLATAKKQLGDCENAQTQSRQVCETAKASCENATRKVDEEERILTTCKAEKEQRDRELKEADSKLGQAVVVCKQAKEQLDTCESKVKQVAGELNKREEILTKTQAEQGKWKIQVDAREQQFSALQETADKARSVLSDVDDDEIFQAATSQANAAAEAMGKALTVAKEKESEASRGINKLTIEVADLKRQLNG
ncbi:MAG: hypothetical protein OSA95_04655 [Opitutales bacterium]|nr:hypothetical protein [Opitutales bacterium]